MKQKIKIVFLLGILASLLTYFQNCARPGEGAMPLFSTQSHHEVNQLEVKTSEPVTMSIPMSQIPTDVKDEDGALVPVEISWTFVDVRGKEIDLHHSLPDYSIARLNADHEGTYKARVDVGLEYYLYHFRLKVAENLGTPVAIETYKRYWLNNRNQPKPKSEKVFNDKTYVEAYDDCLKAYENNRPAKTPNVGILCQYGGATFYTVSHSDPLLQFIAYFVDRDGDLSNPIGGTPELRTKDGAEAKCKRLEEENPDQPVYCIWNKMEIVPN